MRPVRKAVELTDQVGITLLGFLRDGAFNLYTHPERVIGPTCGGT
jgi:FdhD protein